MRFIIYSMLLSIIFFTSCKKITKYANFKKSHPEEFTIIQDLKHNTEHYFNKDNNALIAKVYKDSARYFKNSFFKAKFYLAHSRILFNYGHTVKAFELANKAKKIIVRNKFNSLNIEYDFLLLHEFIVTENYHKADKLKIKINNNLKKDKKSSNYLYLRFYSLEYLLEFTKNKSRNLYYIVEKLEKLKLTNPYHKVLQYRLIMNHLKKTNQDLKFRFYYRKFKIKFKDLDSNIKDYYLLYFGMVEQYQLGNLEAAIDYGECSIEYARSFSNNFFTIHSSKYILPIYIELKDKKNADRTISNIKVFNNLFYILTDYDFMNTMADYYLLSSNNKLEAYNAKKAAYKAYKEIYNRKNYNHFFYNQENNIKILTDYKTYLNTVNFWIILIGSGISIFSFFSLSYFYISNKNLITLKNSNFIDRRKSHKNHLRLIHHYSFYRSNLLILFSGIFNICRRINKNYFELDLTSKKDLNQSLNLSRKTLLLINRYVSKSNDKCILDYKQVLFKDLISPAIKNVNTYFKEVTIDYSIENSNENIYIHKSIFHKVLEQLLINLLQTNSNKKYFIRFSYTKHNNTIILDSDLFEHHSKISSDTRNSLQNTNSLILKNLCSLLNIDLEIILVDNCFQYHIKLYYEDF